MKNTKENVVKLLQAMMRNNFANSRICEGEGEEVVTAYCRGANLALKNVIWLLQDAEYFNAQNRIYNGEAE